MKVLDSCSTSESDDRYYEASVKIREAGTKLYKKSKHTEEINKMMNGYIAQKDINDVDVRLLFGVASKIPMQDLPKIEKKV